MLQIHSKRQKIIGGIGNITIAKKIEMTDLLQLITAGDGCSL